MRLYQVTSGASTTRIGYDGLNRIAEYDAGNAVLRRYIHGPGVDQPIAWYEGSGAATRRFLSADERGSIIAVTDSAGAILAKNAYDDYGIPKSDQGTLPVYGRFAYTGQIWLPELGMYHYKARLYSPTLGRFLQTDPIGYDDQINLYAYVANDPVNMRDPDGQCGYRYDDGSCQVKVDSKTGAAGAAAGKALEGRLNAYDKAVNATKDNASIAVRDSKGNQTGTISGKEYKGIWNNTGFRIVGRAADNGGAGGGTSGSWGRNGDFRSGTSRLTPGVVQDYAGRGVRAGGTADSGRDTLIFHELGHNTNIGRALSQANPAHAGPFGPGDWARERGTSSAASAMLGSVGGSYECDATGCN